MSVLETYLFSFGLYGTFLSMILYILFGQLTVRRLRKNETLKNNLGIERASGWDIINVAQALAIPKMWSEKLENGPLSVFYAKSQSLRENTTHLDRVLAIIFYWVLTVSGISLITLVALNALGVFDKT